MSLGNRLRKLREELKKQSSEIAEMLNIAKSTYSGYENDKSKPDYDTLTELAKYYSVSVDYLLGNTNVRNYTETLAFSTTEDLTEEEIEEVRKYINYLKSQRNEDD
jgi:transcriptional regulator with XRE-family HTH domain